MISFNFEYRSLDILLIRKIRIFINYERREFITIIEQYNIKYILRYKFFVYLVVVRFFVVLKKLINVFSIFLKNFSCRFIFPLSHPVYTHRLVHLTGTLVRVSRCVRVPGTCISSIRIPT